jgi:hypothetical protein
MGCSEDLAHHTPLIQACAGDSGGPVVVSTPTGPVQIGVTSWGPETMNGACGEKFLPDVYMRVAAFTAFINQKKPVIEPFLKRPRSRGFGSAASKVVGNPQVGRTVTCKVTAKLGGDPSKLSYSWIMFGNDIRAIPARPSRRSRSRARCSGPARGPAHRLRGDSPQRGRQPVDALGVVHLKK